MLFQNNIHKIDQCLACGSKNLTLTLDLNTQPLANSYTNRPDEIQEEFPLTINRCQDCCHVQLTHAVDPALMFKHYLYVSGTSSTMKEHFEWFAKSSTQFYAALTKRTANNVLDIGCNDGSQLDQYKLIGLNTYGVDPAENLYERSSRNHVVYLDFFDKKFSSALNKTFDLIVVQNAFAHNYNPIGFLNAANDIMDDNSLLFIQTSQANMIINNEFDTIYHEHISFYNINSMNELVKRANMQLIDTFKCPIHGTSYVFVISKSAKYANEYKIADLIAEERSAGLLTEDTYITYAEKCNQVVSDLVETVNDYKQHGYAVIGYGAAAKGMTLLNYAKLKLDYIIDDNPLKQGKFTPGTSIPIVSIQLLDSISRPILFVPLAWNFYDEIVARIKKNNDRFTNRFCKYFPNVEVES